MGPQHEIRRDRAGGPRAVGAVRPGFRPAPLSAWGAIVRSPGGPAGGRIVRRGRAAHPACPLFRRRLVHHPLYHRRPLCRGTGHGTGAVVGLCALWHLRRSGHRCQGQHGPPGGVGCRGRAGLSPAGPLQSGGVQIQAPGGVGRLAPGRHLHCLVLSPSPALCLPGPRPFGVSPEPSLAGDRARGL